MFFYCNVQRRRINIPFRILANGRIVIEMRGNSFNGKMVKPSAYHTTTFKWRMEALTYHCRNHWTNPELSARITNALMTLITITFSSDTFPRAYYSVQFLHLHSHLQKNGMKYVSESISRKPVNWYSNFHFAFLRPQHLRALQCTSSIRNLRRAERYRRRMWHIVLVSVHWTRAHCAPTAHMRKCLFPYRILTSTLCVFFDKVSSIVRNFDS